MARFRDVRANREDMQVIRDKQDSSRGKSFLPETDMPSDAATKKPEMKIGQDVWSNASPIRKLMVELAEWKNVPPRGRACGGLSVR